jgi:hypothetical protein
LANEQASLRFLMFAWRTDWQANLFGSIADLWWVGLGSLAVQASMTNVVLAYSGKATSAGNYNADGWEKKLVLVS